MCDVGDYLEISVEHHDFLGGYEEINLGAGLRLALGCLHTITVRPQPRWQSNIPAEQGCTVENLGQTQYQPKEAFCDFHFGQLASRI